MEIIFKNIRNLYKKLHVELLHLVYAGISHITAEQSTNT